MSFSGPRCKLTSLAGTDRLEYSNADRAWVNVPKTRQRVTTLLSPTSTGNVAYTGYGFTPTYIRFDLHGPTNGSAAITAQGFTTGTGFQRATSSHVVAGALGAGNTSSSTSACIQYQNQNGTNINVASLVSLDADGFTLNWTTANATQYTWIVQANNIST